LWIEGPENPLRHKRDKLLSDLSDRRQAVGRSCVVTLASWELAQDRRGAWVILWRVKKSLVSCYLRIDIW